MLHANHFLSILFSYSLIFSLIFYPYPLLSSPLTPDTTSNTPSIETAPNQITPVINIVKPNEQGLS
ncbi:MAG: hypothetical protein LBJ88_05870, partial [Campylobacteraceae bacterium]|nr:hypothetical protein [Campylobacteraceae bacterium]